jgi:hypothetical protein
MVRNCANPSCNASFHYLRGGKLFLVDLPQGPASEDVAMRPHRTSEYFWLCDQCCRHMTVMVDEKGEIAVVTIRSARAG